MSPNVIREKIRKEVDKYNKKQPAYRRIIDVVMRDEPFPKTTTRKIKRDCI
jgi:long-chain acyl-CoA synthetase